MSDLKELKNLLMLLSAESEQVRSAVREELLGRENQLSVFLARHSKDLEPELLFHLDELVRTQKSRALRTRWLAWTAVRSEIGQLEMAAGFLAQTLPGDVKFPELSVLLDQLVKEFLLSGEETTIPSLSAFLFGSGRLLGAEEDYFNPLHSNLCFVLSSGRGLPLSLCVIFMLMGARLGLEIEGFNMPGHFLCRYQERGRMVLFDCYHGGHPLSEPELLALSMAPQIPFQYLVDNPPLATDIIFRVLSNLTNAYQRLGDFNRLAVVQELNEDLRNHLHGKTQLSPNVPPRFLTGMVLKHLVYGYRGVVVSVDPSCLADDEWFLANAPQGNKHQPWYHLLVDGSNVTTYVSQDKLSADRAGSEITHPLISMYFRGFEKGAYVRNDRPWSFP